MSQGVSAGVWHRRWHRPPVNSVCHPTDITPVQRHLSTSRVIAARSHQTSGQLNCDLEADSGGLSLASIYRALADHDKAQRYPEAVAEAQAEFVALHTGSVR